MNETSKTCEMQSPQDSTKQVTMFDLRPQASGTREGDVVLRDGSTVHIRVMCAADEPRLVALLQSLSEESRWLRFYSAAGESALASSFGSEGDV